MGLTDNVDYVAQEQAAITREIMKWTQGVRELVVQVEESDPEWTMLMLQGLELLESDPRDEMARPIMRNLTKLMAFKLEALSE